MSDQQTSRLGFSPLLSRWALRGHSRGQVWPLSGGTAPSWPSGSPLHTPLSQRAQRRVWALEL